MQGVHEIDSGERIACESSWIEREIGMVMGGFLWVSVRSIHNGADLKFK